jgi:hypothetical protein
MSNQIIQHQVDLMLFEEGRFSVINWLFREGYLDYIDYRKWRNGETGYLEDYFKAIIPVIIADLEIAQRYAKKLKLESFRISYTSVNNQILHICRSPANELIFTTDYEPAQDRLQMDLFFDSAPACTANDLISAIIDKREDDALRLMSQLKSLAPENYQKFDRLLVLQNELTLSRKTSGRKIKLLLQTVTPLAFDVLGQFAHDFLTPLWCMLSVEVADRYFEAESPEDHLSFTAFKGFQWQQVLSSITREADWIKQPLLVFRYAEACFKLNKELEGLESWFRLFLTFPAAAETLVGSTCNRLLLSDWRHFNELDPELESSFFPAWIVLKKPPLAKNAFDFNCESDGNAALQLICSLVGSKENGLNETTIKLRARLQQQNRNLFIHYMAVNS